MSAEPDFRQTELSSALGQSVVSEFQSPWWARNRHVQTIWPRFFQRRMALTTRKQRLTLDDGDFIDLAWGAAPAQLRGIVVLFHGLEGSIHSHYANDMMATLEKQGLQVVLMHFRGCSGEVNLLPRAYHSGETLDPLFVLKYLHSLYPDSPKIAVGFSLGANMLLKLLGENPDQKYLQAAVAISAPMRLAECADSIDQGFSRLYQKYLLCSMLKNLHNKMQRMSFPAALSIEKVKDLRNFRDFDHHVTAPLHGYAGADDYYQKCSAMDYIKFIQTPTLILHAKDDPFMNHKVIPVAQQLSSAVRLEVSEHGGHVGFMQGTPWRPKIWLHKRVSEFLADYVNTKVESKTP
jgi:predicted alpha/beta-fold hydrolase